MSVILVLQILLSCICLGMLLTGALNAWRVRQDARLLRGQPLPTPAPLISVCVPARNEARNIAACLTSLARQDYPNYEVLMLDDCSEDETASIARQIAEQYPHVRVLAGEPLPPGWIGKPHACHQLSQAARGEYLLFTDADTVFAPDALEKTLRLALARRADLLSGMARMTVKTFWERLSVPMLGLFAIGGLSFDLVTLLSWGWYGAASGAFLFFRRQAYEAIGGHVSVRDQIVEDVALARAVKVPGFRLVLTDVSALVSCRMYTSLREVWEGFTKNMYASFPGGLFVLAILFLLGVFVIPWVSYLGGPLLGWGLWEATILPLFQIGSMALLKAAVDRRAGSPRPVGAFLVAPAALFLSLIALRSAGRALLRQPTPWRARHYELWKG